MKFISQQWKQDKLRCALVVCWLLTVAASFFNSYLLPVQLPGVGTWYAFRTLLPLTALLYVVYAIRTRTFFWKDSTTLEKWCYVFIAVLLLYGAVSLPRALDVAWTFRRLFNLCFDLCFFFLMLRLCRKKDIRRLTIAVYTAVLALYIVLGIYEVFFGGLVNPVYNGFKRFYVLNGLFQEPIVFTENMNDYASVLFFSYAVLSLWSWKRPAWRNVLLTAGTYFLLLATMSRLCTLSFVVLLVVQIFCALLQHQKAARKTAVWMVLCVCCVQFCTQYRYIIPPIQSYLAQRAAYEEVLKEQSSASGAEPLKKPELQLGDPQKESLDEQFFETDAATGEKVLREEGSAGVRSHLLLFAFHCISQSHGLGVGLGNTETMAARQAVVPQWADKPQNSIHCFLMRIAADYGIFALLPLCAIAFLLLKRIFTSLSAAWRRKDGQAGAGALLFFAVLLTYPIVSTASSDAQDDIAMWFYLAMMVLYAVQELGTGEHLLTEETHA